MKKFEYYEIFLRPGEGIIDLLDRYGNDGWEAFAIVPDGDGTVIYLKREKL